MYVLKHRKWFLRRIFQDKGKKRSDSLSYQEYF